MSWQTKGAVLDGGFVAQARASAIQQERTEVYAALQCAASFQCLEWKDCEELKQTSQGKWIFLDKKKGGNEASDGVVCPTSIGA